MRNTFSDRSQGMTRDETSILFGYQSKLFMNTKLRLVRTLKKSAALMFQFLSPFHFVSTIYMAESVAMNKKNKK